MNYSDLRRAGRESLKGNWTLAYLVTLLYIMFAVLLVILSYSLENPQALQEDKTTYITDIITFLYYIFLDGALILGYTFLFLLLAQKSETKFDDFFVCFKDWKQYGRSIIFVLLTTIYLILWFLLLIVPGIIKCFAYAMTPFLLADDPKLGVNEAITQSRKMMKGYKWKYFVLSLTFLGWFIIVILSFGIGAIWILPYYQATVSQFYLKLKENAEYTAAT